MPAKRPPGSNIVGGCHSPVHAGRCVCGQAVDVGQAATCHSGDISFLLDCGPLPGLDFSLYKAWSVG